MRVALRAGHSLVELVVATAVGGVFLALLTALLTAEARLARTAAEHVARQDALRVAWAVLSSELRYATTADVRAGATDSIALRALRGVLLPCAAGIYRYRGLREPDPGKDSLVTVWPGAVLPVRLAAAPPADACGAVDDDALLRLQPLPDAVDPAMPLLLFESGAYHVQARALRYRLGGEGRQPLTGEWFDAASGFLPSAAGVPAVRLRLTPRRIATSHEAAASEVTLRFWSFGGGGAVP